MNSKIFIILHPYSSYVYTLYNLFAHSSCTFLLTLLFIKSTVSCPAHSILLHILSYIVFFFTFILHFVLLHTNTYVYSLVFVLHKIALSMERT